MNAENFVTENDTALLREIAHSLRMPGYPEVVVSRARCLLREVAAHFDEQRNAGVTTCPACKGEGPLCAICGEPPARGVREGGK